MVGECPVLLVLGLLSLLEQEVYEVSESGFVGLVAGGGLGCESEYVEGKSLEEVDELGCDGGGDAGFTVEYGMGDATDFEELADDLGCGHVVVHGIVEGLSELVDVGLLDLWLSGGLHSVVEALEVFPSFL